MSDTSKLTIFKQNSMIRGYFINKDNELITPSGLVQDIINGLVKLVQKKLYDAQPKDYEKNKMFNTSLSEFLHILSFDSNDYDVVKNALKELNSYRLVLKDFVEPINGRRVKEYYSHLVKTLVFLKEVGRSKKDEIEIELDTIFLINILRHTGNEKFIGNFTPISIATVREIKSKHAKRFYEYVSSVYPQNEFSLGIESLSKLFGVIHPTLSGYTKILRRLPNNLNGTIEFEYTPFRKDKLISFLITKTDIPEIRKRKIDTKKQDTPSLFEQKDTQGGE